MVYEKNQQKEAILKAKELRKTGTFVELMEKAEDKPKEAYENFAKGNRMERVLFL